MTSSMSAMGWCALLLLMNNLATSNSIRLKNGTHETIDVLFYTNASDSNGQQGCRPIMKTILPFKLTTVTPKNCAIAKIQVKHTPEEEHEQVTNQELSVEQQKQKTAWIYKGPNIIVLDTNN